MADWRRERRRSCGSSFISIPVGVDFPMILFLNSKKVSRLFRRRRCPREGGAKVPVTVSGSDADKLTFALELCASIVPIIALQPKP